MKAHLKYLKYVLIHKWFVFWECRNLKLSLWTAFFHDWDKFMPDEWFAYVRRFGGGNDPQDALNDPRYQMAWHLHQKRNKHHWQWWCTPQDDGRFRVLEMSDKARREMLADWRGMGRAFNSHPVDWYTENRHKIHLAPKTRQWIEVQLGYREDYDLKDIIDYIDAYCKVEGNTVEDAIKAVKYVFSVEFEEQETV